MAVDGCWVVKHTFAELDEKQDDDDAHSNLRRNRADTDTLIDYSVNTGTMLKCCDFASETTADSESSPRSVSEHLWESLSSSSPRGSSSDGTEWTSLVVLDAQTSDRSWAEMDDDDTSMCTLVPALSHASSPQGMAVSVSKSSRWGGPRPKRQIAPTEALEEGIGQDRTSIKVSGLPAQFSRDSVVLLLQEEGLAELVDFLYVPVDLLTWVHYGFAFLNFNSPTSAQRAVAILQGFRPCDSETDLLVEYSDHQGLEAHVEKHRNNGVMHHTVPDEYKPLRFESGMRVAFPPPTKRIQLQRLRQELRRRQKKSGECLTQSCQR